MPQIQPPVCHRTTIDDVTPTLLLYDKRMFGTDATLEPPELPVKLFSQKNIGRIETNWNYSLCFPLILELS